jgi:sugar phosphate isomerase/epimerase
MRQQFSRRSCLLGAAGLTAALNFKAVRAQTESTKNSEFEAPAVQLYTVREQLSADAAGTLRALWDSGFRRVEFFDVESHAAAIKLALDMGFEILNLHFWELFDNEEQGERWVAGEISGVMPLLTTAQLRSSAERFGIKTLVYSNGPPRAACLDVKAAERFCAVITSMGTELHSAGIKFIYHPHTAEFNPLQGGSLYQMLVADIAPRYLSFELDTFWLAHIGLDPAQQIALLGSRAELIHLKDRRKSVLPAQPLDDFPEDGGIFVPVGQGSIDVPAVLAAARIAGARHIVLEQDEAAGNPVLALQQSLGFIKRLSVGSNSSL